MQQLGRRCAIAVMAKAPLAGRSKTRLVPPLSAQEAARMSAAFLRDVTENIALAATRAPIDGWVAYAPAAEAAGFDGMLAAGTGLVLADGSIEAPPGVQHLGRCLLHAARMLFGRGYAAVALLNADSPTLPTPLLGALCDRLLAPGPRAVLGPAEDGGYYAIGLKAPEPSLFEDIDWSTDRVAAQTIARAEACGLKLHMLPPWYDIDDRAGLRRLLADLRHRPAGPLEPYAAPATAAWAERARLADLIATA
jgi:rSAM/selenodomain-associated transferase 1